MSDKATVWQRYGSTLLYWITFVGVLGLAVFVNERYPRIVEVHFSEWTASFFVQLMRVIGMGGEVQGIYINNRYCSFSIIGECTAYYPLAIYLAATLAFPVRWWRKIVGIGVGIPLLLLINQARLITLCWIFSAYRDLFDAIHALIWQSLMIFFTVVVWILWVATLGQRDEA